MAPKKGKGGPSPLKRSLDDRADGLAAGDRAKKLSSAKAQDLPWVKKGPREEQVDLYGHHVHDVDESPHHILHHEIPVERVSPSKALSIKPPPTKDPLPSGAASKLRRDILPTEHKSPATIQRIVAAAKVAKAAQQERSDSEEEGEVSVSAAGGQRGGSSPKRSPLREAGTLFSAAREALRGDGEGGGVCVTCREPAQADPLADHIRFYLEDTLGLNLRRTYNLLRLALATAAAACALGLGKGLAAAQGADLLLPVPTVRFGALWQALVHPEVI